MSAEGSSGTRGGRGRTAEATRDSRRTRTGETNSKAPLEASTIKRESTKNIRRSNVYILYKSVSSNTALHVSIFTIVQRFPVTINVVIQIQVVVIQFVQVNCIREF